MYLVDLLVVVFVEGVAELLPIDAGGHAVLLVHLLGWRVESLRSVICLASALAAMLFLWRDMRSIAAGLWAIRRQRFEPGLSLLLKICLIGIPWLALQMFWPAPKALLGPASVGAITLGSALIMILIDRLCMTVKRIEHVTFGAAIIIGILQAIAWLPGVGRSAAALTMARLFGLERAAAFRFSILTTIPLLLILGSRSPSPIAEGVPLPLAAGAGVMAFALALITLAVGMALTRRWGSTPFAIYRLLIGAALLALAFV